MCSPRILNPKPGWRPCSPRISNPKRERRPSESGFRIQDGVRRPSGSGLGNRGLECAVGRKVEGGRKEGWGEGIGKRGGKRGKMVGGGEGDAWRGHASDCWMLEKYTRGYFWNVGYLWGWILNPRLPLIFIHIFIF